MRAQVDVEVAGALVTLSYVQSGQGPTVLLLHGWLHSAEIWTDVAPRLVRAGHSVIALDLPGFGQSPPPCQDLASLEGYASLLSAFVAQLPEGRVDALVADSLGARIALEALRAGRELRCDRMMLSGCPFEGLPALVDVIRRLRMPLWSLSLLRSAPARLAKGLVALPAKYTVHSAGVDMGPIVAGAVQSDPRTAQVLLGEMRRKVETDLADLRKPSSLVLLRGEFDPLITVDTQEKWASRLGAQSIQLLGVGHTPMLETPDRYAEAVLSLF